ncbi:nuclear speckle splicing regulatory protein 1 [Crotalus adamanteus]|uniref:Nuclear speckle splicing regulatory protein 1 n=1 Tax=Crotalus adamanteus TaxID=8729 RepID=A0AAW1CDZ9_CROAD
MEDSDDESSISESLQREALKKQAMKQTKLEIQRALAEDSTVYEYDNIYEDIQQKKAAESQASILVGKEEKKPKYIQNILQAAELRKKEQERRMEKKIQKERESEGDAFQDKEAFVTSAYKKKLQERAEEEERERREAAVEASLDVTKQKDLSGFYRHLLNQTVGEEKAPHCSLRGAGFKGEDLTEKPTGSHQGLESKTRTRVPGKGEENLDADSDLRTDSSDSEGVPERSGERKAAEAGDGYLRGRHSMPRQSERDSRSPSEERRPHSPQAEKRDRRRDEARQHDGKNHPRRHGKDERSRTEGHHRRREDRHRKKDREEEEKQEHRRGREKKERRSREKDQDEEREKGRGRDAASREDRDEKPKHGWKRSSGSVAQEEPQTPGGNLPSPEKSPQLTHEASADSGETLEKPAEKVNKFAKRSDQETVSSARDRYLARQMARLGNKTYVEKEED